MDAFDTSLARRPRVVGLKLGVIVLVLLLIVGAWVGAYYWAKHTGQLKRVEHVIGQYDYGWPSWMGKGAKKATYHEPPVEPNHAAFDPRDAELKRLQAELERQRQLLEALRQQKATPASPPPVAAKPATPAPNIKRPALGFISHERTGGVLTEDEPTISPGTFIQGTLQTVLNSEVPGYFTLKTSLPVFDATGQVLIIPQGQSIVAKDTSSALLFGNERIPTFAVTLTLPGGREVDLGDAPVLDAAGTNGLTGEVNNHVWRLVWTSILIEGLRAGQQVVQQEIAHQGNGVTVTGIGQHSGNLAQQRLGRAQDTRPTIIAAAGQIVNVLVLKSVRISSSVMAKR